MGIKITPHKKFVKKNINDHFVNNWLATSARLVVTGSSSMNLGCHSMLVKIITSCQFCQSAKEKSFRRIAE